MSQQFTSNLAGFQGTRFENEALKYSRQLKEWKNLDKKDRNLNFIIIAEKQKLAGRDYENKVTDKSGCIDWIHYYIYNKKK